MKTRFSAKTRVFCAETSLCCAATRFLCASPFSSVRKTTCFMRKLAHFVRKSTTMNDRFRRTVNSRISSGNRFFRTEPRTCAEAAFFNAEPAFFVRKPNPVGRPSPPRPPTVLERNNARFRPGNPHPSSRSRIRSENTIPCNPSSLPPTNRPPSPLRSHPQSFSNGTPLDRPIVNRV